MFLAMFTILYGGFAAANASSYSPDVGKATKAASRIFQIVDRPTEIDAIDVDEDNCTKIEKSYFQGKIEFKDVWFRYPSRLQEWVFKGLNLTIHPNDTIAIVGESG